MSKPNINICDGHISWEKWIFIPSSKYLRLVKMLDMHDVIIHQLVFNQLWFSTNVFVKDYNLSKLISMLMKLVFVPRPCKSKLKLVQLVAKRFLGKKNIVLLGGGAKIVVTLYCFLRLPYLNFNHVIIMKKFHNFFAYYGRWKP